MNLINKIMPMRTYKIKVFVVFNGNPVAHLFVTSEGRTKKAARANAERNLAIKAGHALEVKGKKTLAPKAAQPPKAE